MPKTDKAVFISLEEHISKYDIHKVLKDKYDSYQVISVPNVTSGQASTCQIGIISAGVDSDTPITISACDNGVYYDSHKYKTLLDDPTIDVIVWSFRNNQASKVNPHMYSWLDVDVNNNIKYVSCKNFIYENPLQTHAIIGTMFFRKAKYFLDGLVENHKNKFTTNGEYYVDDVINRCIEAGLTVKVFEVENYICWGTPDDYKTYLYWEEHFKKGVI